MIEAYIALSYLVSYRNAGASGAVVNARRLNWNTRNLNNVSCAQAARYKRE